MHDALGMRRVEGISDINGNRHQQFELERLVADQVLQSLAFQVLHGDEGAALVLTYVIDSADVRVIQAGSRLGFAAEAA